MKLAMSASRSNTGATLAGSPRFRARIHRAEPSWRSGGGPLVDPCDRRPGVSLTDADGGGLQLSGGSHPVLRQYTDSVAALRLKGPVANVAPIIGELWAAHVALVDDWIRPERYLGPPKELQARLASHRRTVCRGPAFLVRHYARILARRGVGVSVASSAARRRRSVQS
jgi:hypothetical protein